MSDDLETERVEEQVLTVDNLVKVEARVLILRNDLLFHALLFSKRSGLVQCFRINESVVQFAL